MRRYEFKEGTSSKFWAIALAEDGETFTTRFGRLGSEGQTAVKEFDSPSQARAAYDKLIAEKEKKGYKLVSADDGANAASNPELEAALVKKPDDVAAYQVYADWLQSQNDPRGELITVHAELLKAPTNAKLKKRAKEILTKHEAHFLGDLMRIEGANEGVEVSWRLGFLESARIGMPEDTDEDVDAKACMRTLLKLPSAKVLRTLRVGLFGAEDGEPEYGPLVKVMAQTGLPPTLRKLAFDIGDFQISWASLGDISALFPQLKNLEELRIKMGNMELGKIVLPALRVFEVVTGGFTKKNMKSVVGATWPKLESLTLYFGSHNYGANCDIKDVKPLLAGTGLGKVKHLGLCNAEFEDAIAQEIPGAKIVKQLETLDLSKGMMTDTGAKALIDGAASLKHLKKLDVSRNYLSKDAQKSLKKALPNADVGSQGDPNEEYRYVQVSE